MYQAMLLSVSNISLSAGGIGRAEADQKAE
jgi:hypothetical protein